jgi:aminoglycoside phosphotransferase (APT) family kinase protein
LPHIQQHGDFVMNNLGATRAGLVVFDWEDFGRVALPGLDLCTLVASDTGFSADQLRAITRGDNRLAPAYAQLIDRSCPLIGLTPQLFRQLIPLYLVIFLDLKRGYGKTIGQVVGKLIHDIRGP